MYLGDARRLDYYYYYYYYYYVSLGFLTDIDRDAGRHFLVHADDYIDNDCGLVDDFTQAGCD